MIQATADPEELVNLLAAVGAGDQRAFAQLYERCSSHLYGLLLRMLKRADLAEEALQDCFLKIWQKSDTYEPAKGAPLAWLSTVARYRALDLLRAKRPEVELPEWDGALPEAEDHAGNPLAMAAAEEGAQALERCLDTLAEEQRRSVLLAYYEGYTHQELARVLTAPLGTVKSWVRRGLMRLRDCLQP